MIGCDNCDGWFHARCVNITVAEAERLVHFICPPCKAKRKRKDSKAEKKKSKKTSLGRGGGSGQSRAGVDYRPPARKPSQRIKRNDLRRAAAYQDAIPYEPNFDTSGSEAEEAADDDIPMIPESDVSDSDESVELGHSAHGSTLLVDVHSYSVTQEDLGANMSLKGLDAEERDNRVIAHLNQRAFEIACDLHKTQSRKQIKKSGLAFARRETVKLNTTRCYKKHKNAEIPEFSLGVGDSLLRGINKVRQLREVCEHNMKCGTCNAYIPIQDFSKHLVECAMLEVMRTEEKITRIKKKGKKRKLVPKIEICGCPMLDPMSENFSISPKNESGILDPNDESKVEKDTRKESNDIQKNDDESRLEKPGDQVKEEKSESKDTEMEMDAKQVREKSTQGHDVKAKVEEPNLEKKDELASKPVEKVISKKENGIKEVEIKRTRSQTSDAALMRQEIVGRTLLPDITKGAITAGYSGYCDKLKSECSIHAGWETRWDAEIAQQWFFHNQRLKLVQEEIAAVEKARAERHREIELARRKTDGNEGRAGLNERDLESRGRMHGVTQGEGGGEGGGVGGGGGGVGGIIGNAPRGRMGEMSGPSRHRAKPMGYSAAVH